MNSLHLGTPPYNLKLFRVASFFTAFDCASKTAAQHHRSSMCVRVTGTTRWQKIGENFIHEKLQTTLSQGWIKPSKRGLKSKSSSPKPKPKQGSSLKPKPSSRPGLKTRVHLCIKPRVMRQRFFRLNSNLI